MPGQLGDDVSAVEPGDGMRLVALVVEGAAPPLQLEVVTQRIVPNLVTVSGLLDASVRGGELLAWPGFPMGLTKHLG